MGKRSKQKSLGVLSKQNPKKRNEKSGKKPLLFSLFLVLIAGFSGYYAMVLSDTDSQNKTSNLDNKKSSFSQKLESIRSKVHKKIPLTNQQLPTFIIKPDSNGAQSANEIKRLISIAQSTYKESPQNPLLAISKEIQIRSKFARVHAIKTKDNSIIITTIKRKPFLVINADKQRFMTKEGVVYGEVKANQDISMFITLSGLTEEKPNVNRVVNQDNSIQLHQKELVRIEEVLKLTRLAKHYKLNFSKIEFKEYRGFLAVLKDSEIEVSFGRAPFQARFARLEKILENLKSKGILYSKIELDYDGKAFIKEKSM